jgi:hypothetical protein
MDFLYVVLTQIRPSEERVYEDYLLQALRVGTEWQARKKENGDYKNWTQSVDIGGAANNRRIRI